MPGSAPNLNVVTLVGQLTADPEFRQLPDDRSVCDLRLAVNDQKDQPPLFLDVATFGKGAGTCAWFLSKGRAIPVTSRRVYKGWQAKDGSNREARRHWPCEPQRSPREQRGGWRWRRGRLTRPRVPEGLLGAWTGRYFGGRRAPQR